MDGTLEITSTPGQGIAYMIVLPQSWQGSMQEVNALVLATDISRKHTRAEIKKLQHLTTSLTGELPDSVISCFDNLRYRIQELGILCNRSLYLVEDYCSQLEACQERWLQREIEQVHTIETLVNMCQEIARTVNTCYLFDLESARRVARNALAIATELKVNADDRQALWHAALLKDLGLVLSQTDMVELEIVASTEIANSLKTRFKPIWKALSIIDFLKSPLNLISYSYEKYCNNGGASGTRKAEIPLGAKILAVVRTYEYMTYNPIPAKSKTPRAAVQEIIKGSEITFDPEVINAFLLYGRNSYPIKPSPNQDKKNMP
jgi:response regulator RpfG family c-di-GMP phosphodiesterase